MAEKVKYLSVRQCGEKYGAQMRPPNYGPPKEANRTMAIWYAIRKGYIPVTIQNDVRFIREPDFLDWLERYNAGEFHPGKKQARWIDPEETAAKLSTANQA
jgi:hypothetical protein